MDVVLMILAFVLIIGSVVGSVLPALPGPPLGYVAILLMHLTDWVDYSVSFLLLWLVIVVVVTVLDNVLPIWTTKKFGGSKRAMWGSVIGLLVGMFVPPVGIILGTLLGAIIGEMTAGSDLSKSLKAGFGTFVGFILTTGGKLICCGFFVYYYFRELYTIIFV